MHTRPFAVKLAVTTLLLFALSKRSTSQAPISAPEVATAPEGLSSYSTWVHSIESDLIAEKFDDLDRMAAGYRLNKDRLPAAIGSCVTSIPHSTPRSKPTKTPPTSLLISSTG